MAPADAPLSSQRSEVVKSSLTVQKSLLLSSEGVASKRNFFEASAPSKAEPLAVRKVRAGAGLNEDLPVGSCAGAATNFLDESSPLWIPTHSPVGCCLDAVWWESGAC